MAEVSAASEWPVTHQNPLSNTNTTLNWEPEIKQLMHVENQHSPADLGFLQISIYSSLHVKDNRFIFFGFIIGFPELVIHIYLSTNHIYIWYLYGHCNYRHPCSCTGKILHKVEAKWLLQFHKEGLYEQRQEASFLANCICKGHLWINQMYNLISHIFPFYLLIFFYLLLQFLNYK